MDSEYIQLFLNYCKIIITLVEAKTSMKELIDLMVEADLERVKKEAEIIIKMK